MQYITRMLRGAKAPAEWTDDTASRQQARVAAVREAHDLTPQDIEAVESDGARTIVLDASEWYGDGLGAKMVLRWIDGKRTVVVCNISTPTLGFKTHFTVADWGSDSAARRGARHEAAAIIREGRVDRWATLDEVRDRFE